MPLNEPPEPPERDFQRFKSAAVLVGAAAMEAKDFLDLTVQLENAFAHPLYTENRLDFANALSDAIATGIETALA